LPIGIFERLVRVVFVPEKIDKKIRFHAAPLFDWNRYCRLLGLY
jgi:hypothetical protein